MGRIQEFGCYLTDSSESWKDFEQVRVNLRAKTGFGLLLRSINKSKVRKLRYRNIAFKNKKVEAASSSLLLWRVSGRSHR